MASATIVDVTKESSYRNIFLSWKEKVANESCGNRRIEFFVQLGNFLWVLAVIGVEADNNVMKFVIDPTFYLQYKEKFTNLGKGEWEKACDVVIWLNEQMSHGPFIYNNDNILSDETTEHINQVMSAGDFSMVIDREGARASLAFPSGYNDAYSIPSRVQMVLKHGAKTYNVLVQDGYLTHGWNRFVIEHQIRCGYTVKFQFSGCSTYETEIYDWKKEKKVYGWSNIKYHEWL